MLTPAGRAHATADRSLKTDEPGTIRDEPSRLADDFARRVRPPDHEQVTDHRPAIRAEVALRVYPPAAGDHVAHQRAQALNVERVQSGKPDIEPIPPNDRVRT